jgi:hypothetical protein
MRKCLLGVFAVGFLASIAQGGAYAMPKSQITLTPQPLFAGQEITIQAGPNMNIVVDMDPGGRWRLTTDSDGKAKFTPQNDGTIYVSDPGGNWLPASDVVAP